VLTYFGSNLISHLDNVSSFAGVKPKGIGTLQYRYAYCL